MLEIGEIVSKDEATDSAVFEVTNSLVENCFDYLKLLPKSGLCDQQLDLPRPSLDLLPPTERANVVIYGAWTRGARCTISNPSVLLDDSEESAALLKDVGFEKEPSCLKRATDDGDCGALYLEAINGRPIAMHHALIKFSWPGTDKPDKFESYGVPLSLIMAKHPEQIDEEIFGSIQTTANGDNVEQDGSNILQRESYDRDDYHQGAHMTVSLQVKKFPVKIFTEYKARPSMGDTSSDREVTRGDESKATKTMSRQIRTWNVKRH